MGFPPHSRERFSLIVYQYVAYTILAKTKLVCDHCHSSWIRWVTIESVPECGTESVPLIQVGSASLHFIHYSRMFQKNLDREGSESIF